MDVMMEALGLVVVRPENISVVLGTQNRFGLGILGMFLMTLLWVLGNVRKGSYRHCSPDLLRLVSNPS